MKEGKTIVILEGFHVCKHALRFEADIVELVTPDRERLTAMLDQYAPDIKKQILDKVQVIDYEQFEKYSNVIIRTPLAGRAVVSQQNLSEQGIVVLLDNPRDLENIGAVVRLSAGMNVEAVAITGDVDPWHKNCLRGSQGLHFAVPVLHIDQINGRYLCNRPVIVFDETGQDLATTTIPGNAVLVFGSERQGVSQKWLDHSDTVVKIPQRDGVSSYNLATSVAMGVYHARIGRAD